MMAFSSGLGVFTISERDRNIDGKIQHAVKSLYMSHNRFGESEVTTRIKPTAVHGASNSVDGNLKYAHEPNRKCQPAPILQFECSHCVNDMILYSVVSQTLTGRKQRVYTTEQLNIVHAEISLLFH